jgi:O-antigen chain-terminating methyltransferase
VDQTDLAALRARLEEEEEAYSRLLDSLDGLATFPIPGEPPSPLPQTLSRLNGLWEAPAPPTDGGLGAPLRREARKALAPTLARQQEFNAALVQLLNERVARTDELHAHLRQVISTLVQYLQKVQPVMDARDRLSSAQATTRSELILEAFDRRLESLARRLDGFAALRDTTGALVEEVRGLRTALAGPPPKEAVARGAVVAAEDSLYTAFENRYRGDRDEIRSRLEGYAALFAGLSPVVDLGCGRGEFLEILGGSGIRARGVDGNARAVQECASRGLDAVHEDIVAFLRGEAEGAWGGVFAAQVAEHLPPRVLTELLREAYRVLRKGGLLALETVNPRSLVGFLEVFNRDLTHEKPLHPETLSFLTAAAGFTDVRTELRAPVNPGSKLQPVPPEGLPPRAAATLNENVERLNGLLYGPQEYVLLARR